MNQTTIDTRIGGLGDVLMRLNALYALSALSGASVRVLVGGPLLEIATALYGTRLQVDGGVPPAKDAYVFTHHGLRQLLPAVLTGRRFVNPFVRELARQTGRSAWKSPLNLMIFRLLDGLDRVLMPRRDAAESYSGWVQISGLPIATRITNDAAREQLVRDFGELRSRLQRLVPLAPTRSGATIFPSGTSFQIMPPHVAAALARREQVRFAFHAGDPYAETFRSAGLETVRFTDARGLLALAAGSARSLSTDSFPSHLLQLYSPTSVIALSQSPGRRIVHPGFDGQVVESTAPCCPCVNHARVRGACPAGRAYCYVWEDVGYRDVLFHRASAANVLEPCAAAAD